VARIDGFGAVDCDDHIFVLGDCGNAVGVIVIENFRLNIEYLRNSFYLKRSERSGIYKYSICILQFSIPACPGWDLKGFNHEVKQVLCRSALMAFAPAMLTGRTESQPLKV